MSADGTARSTVRMTTTPDTTSLREGAWLLQNQLNPFPIAGDLVLQDGRLSFTLTDLAAEASLGWLEKHLDMDDVKARIRAGQSVVAFDVPVAGLEVSWPLSLGKVGMKIKAADRNWVVALDYPSGGALWQTLNLITGRKKSKAWRAALAASGAR